MKTETYNAFLIVLLILILFALAFIIVGLRSDGVDCVREPLIYGVQKLSYANDAPIECQCTAYKDNPIHFSFDQDGFIDEPYRYIGNNSALFPVVNFSFNP